MFRYLERYKLGTFAVIVICLALVGCASMKSPKEKDFDGDGVKDKTDKCPEYYDPQQKDFDLDGIGDVCDEDADNDTYISAFFPGGNDCHDLNPNIYPGNGCPAGGISFTPPPEKGNKPPSDDDGIPDAKDNCPTVDNPNQENSDPDKYGDACDTCPNFNNPDQSIPVWYKDLDKDLYSDGTTLTQCDRPTDYKLASELTAVTGDCDDSDPSVNPGVQNEIPDNGKDDDCDLSTPDTVQTYTIVIKDWKIQRCGDASCSSVQDVAYKDWGPVYGESIIAEFQVMGPNGEIGTTPNHAGEVVTTDLAFSLAPGPAGQNNPVNSNNPTNYPGTYLNDPSEAGSSNPSADYTADFQFAAGKIKLVSLDYGGSIKIRASVSMELGDGTPVGLQEDFAFPKDKDFDGLGDFWEDMYGNLMPGDDLENDVLQVVDEYRGCKWGRLVKVMPNAVYDTVAYVPETPPQGAVTHIRTSPDRRDLFVKFVGYDVNWPFAIGEAFHKLNPPVDVHALGESEVATLPAGSDDYRIDVATITLEPGTYNPIPSDPTYAQPGHIMKRGIRDWTFATLGASSYGGDTYYGATSNLYKKAHQDFFSDKPYDDYTTLKQPGGNMGKQQDWLCNGTYQNKICTGDNVGNGLLDPIGSCEDKNDNGELNSGEDKSKNTVLDGDHPVPNNTDIDGDGHMDEWDYWEDLSAFDVNKSNEVEVPVVGSVDQIVPLYENTLAQEVKCVTTHELGHSSGVTLHTSVSTCIMFGQTNNLIRDDSFSQDAADLVRIHNY